MSRGIAFLLLLLAAPAWAGDAGDWLARLGPALRQQQYQGTLVYVSGPRVETIRIFHAFDAGRERERLVALSGPRREVIRDRDRVMYIGSGDASTGVGGPDGGRWSPAAGLAVAAGLQGYTARLAGRARVAGHEAQVVEVVAADRWRYGFRLWLERGSALPLRTAILDADGGIVEQVAFTELELGQRPAERDLMPSSRAGLRALPTGHSQPGDDPGWRVASPPPGFVLKAARRLENGVQLLYGDGLASVSVYIERRPVSDDGESATRHGAVHARAFWRDGWRVLAIGKVPAATVERFARTVKSPAASNG